MQAHRAGGLSAASAGPTAHATQQRIVKTWIVQHCLAALLLGLVLPILAGAIGEPSGGPTSPAGHPQSKGGQASRDGRVPIGSGPMNRGDSGGGPPFEDRPAGAGDRDVPTGGGPAKTLAAMRTLCRCRLMFEAYNLPPASLFDQPDSTPAERALARELWRLKAGRPLVDECARALDGAPGPPCQGVFFAQLHAHSTQLLARDVVAVRVLAAEMCRRGWMWVDIWSLPTGRWDPLDRDNGSNANSNFDVGNDDVSNGGRGSGDSGGGFGRSSGRGAGLVAGLPACRPPLPILVYSQVLGTAGEVPLLREMAARWHPQPVLANVHPDMGLLTLKGSFWQTVAEHAANPPRLRSMSSPPSGLMKNSPASNPASNPTPSPPWSHASGPAVVGAGPSSAPVGTASPGGASSAASSPLLPFSDVPEHACRDAVVGKLVPQTWRLFVAEECAAFFQELARNVADARARARARAASLGGEQSIGQGQGVKGMGMEERKGEEVEEPWYVVKQSAQWAGRGTFLVVPSMLPPRGGKLAAYDHGRICGAIGERAPADKEKGGATPANGKGGASANQEKAAKSGKEKAAKDAVDVILSREEIAQVYVRDPLLLRGGRKFHVRTYAVVASWHPLLVFFSPGASYYQVGSMPYDRNDVRNMTGHITNVREDTQPVPRGTYAFSGIRDRPAEDVQRQHGQVKDAARNPAGGWQVPGGEEDWGTLGELGKELASSGMAPSGYVNDTLLPSMGRAVVFALRALHSHMRPLVERDGTEGGPPAAGDQVGQHFYQFRLLALDFMLTSTLQLKFLEVNHNPFIIRTPPHVVADTVGLGVDVLEARMRGLWPVQGHDFKDQTCTVVDGDARFAQTCGLGPPVARVLNLTRYAHLEVLIDEDWDTGNIGGCG